VALRQFLALKFAERPQNVLPTQGRIHDAAGLQRFHHAQGDRPAEDRIAFLRLNIDLSSSPAE